MTSAYNDVISSNKRSGRNQETCPFYDEMHKFLGGRPALLKSASRACYRVIQVHLSLIYITIIDIHRQVAAV